MLIFTEKSSERALDPVDSSFFECPVCKDTRVHIEPETWQCLSCHTEFPVKNGIPYLVKNWQDLEYQINEAVQRLPGWYKSEQQSEENNIWRHHLRKRRQLVEEKIKDFLSHIQSSNVDRLLDIGCGDGNHLNYLAKYAGTLYGSDYNPTRLERARENNPQATIFLGDILNYPAADQFFDVIFFNHVIEHISDDVQALHEVSRILKAGGLLVLGTPNEGATWWQVAYKLQPKVREASDHVHFYTKADLVEKVKNAGFQVDGFEYIGWGVPHWTFDRLLRQYKLFDDFFELVGKRIIPKQASSIYLFARKL